jgi:hypothetical protein
MARKHDRSSAIAQWFMRSLHEAEPDLQARITAVTVDQHPRRRWVRPLMLALAIAGLGIGLTTSGLDVGAQSGRDLVGVSSAFLAGLAEDDLAAALSVCAESPQGRLLLEPEQRRVFGVVTNAATNQDDAMKRRHRILGELRDSLAQSGVDWSAVNPVAFAGVRSKVFEPAIMRESADIIWGHIYFETSGQVYAIEVTAWRCAGSYVIVDVWDWAPIAVRPNAIRAYAKDRYDESVRAGGEKLPEAQIIRPRRVFTTI